MLEKAVGVTT